MSLLSILSAFRRKTVAGIVSRFHGIIAELEALEKALLAEVGYHQAAIDDHAAQAKAAQDEAAQAAKVAGNIKALVS